jgi:hypothetical protein
MKQPSDEARQQVIDWIGAQRKNEALKSAGDPGPVLARRPSNAEYNYTIRDLTGVDLRPAREFPIDPANHHAPRGQLSHCGEWRVPDGRGRAAGIGGRRVSEDWLPFRK